MLIKIGRNLIEKNYLCRATIRVGCLETIPSFIEKSFIEMDVEISKLLGQRGNLYYRNDLYCFQLGTVLFEVLEDESDGYRSYMGELRVLSDSAPMGQFLGEIEVVNISTDDKNLYALQDVKDKFNWVEFGTENTNDYYPYFVFRNNVRKEESGQVVREGEPEIEFEEVIKKIKA